MAAKSGALADSDLIMMPCLGRPFALGMLYDCRNDTVVPEMTLWDNARLKFALNSNQKFEYGYKIIAEDCLESKATNLDIGASLKLSCLSGLIKVKGSAKYLDDHAPSMHQSRICLKYWSTSGFDQLRMDRVGDVQFPDVFQKKAATHVVIGVQYGADAFFVFDRKINDENKLIVKSLMKALVNMVPDAKFKLIGNDREEADKFECKFHGDLHLPSNPTTFDSAVKTYHELPELLKQGVVAKRVLLCPLTKLNCDAAKVVHEVSIDLVSQAQKVMEDMLELEMHANDLMNTSVYSLFSAIQLQLSDFKEKVIKYKTSFSRKLMDLLPRIREGRVNESALAEVITLKETSPFSSHALSTWIKAKAEEIKCLETFLHNMQAIKSIEFALTPFDLGVILRNPDIDFVICFSFKVIASNDVLLEQMETHSRHEDINPKGTRTNPWFRNKQLMDSLTNQVKQFISSAKANERMKKTKFVVTDGGEMEDDNGAEILLYNKGIPGPFSHPLNLRELAAAISRVSVELEPASNADSVKSNASKIRVRAKTDTGASTTTQDKTGRVGNRIKQWEAKKTGNETSLDLQSYPESNVNGKYNSGASHRDTLRSAILSNPFCVKICEDEVTHCSVKLQWHKPISGADSVTHYTVSYKLKSHTFKGKWEIKQTSGNETSLTVEDLQADKEYQFRVRAECDAGVSQYSETVQATTHRVLPPREGRMSKDHVTSKSYSTKHRREVKETSEYKTSLTIKGSQADSQYLIRARDDTESEYSDTVLATTVREPSSDTSLDLQSYPESNVNGKYNSGASHRDTLRSAILSNPFCVKICEDEVTHCSVKLQWHKPISGADSVKHYMVSYKLKSHTFEGKWEIKQTSGNETSLTVEDLQADKEYQFRVRAECDAGVSQYSETVQATTHRVLPPREGRMSKDHVTSKSYSTKHRREVKETSGYKTSLTIKGSQADSQYLIRARDDTESEYSDTVLATTVREPSSDTKPIQNPTHADAEVSEYSDLYPTLRSPEDRLADVIKAISTPIESKLPQLSLFKLPQEEMSRLSCKLTHTVEIGQCPNPDSTIQHKVLLTVGATGAGKSTLINGMVNYILGVEWKDDFRFKLIADQLKSQTKSVTSEITAYTIHHMDGSRVPYSLTIIDTPGFGDTAGLERDKEITQQIKEFFSLSDGNGIDHLDAIGFVTQSALIRLTPTQRYISDSILSIFGNDVAKNIFIMVTFCDGQKPPVIEAVRKANVPYNGYFKFNNSALFADNSNNDDDNFDKKFWKMGMKSFKKFFAEFHKVESVSLTLTRDVLAKREELEVAIEGLQKQIDACLGEMEVLHQEKLVLQKYEAQITANEDFSYEIMVPYYKTIKLPNSEYATNCLNCHYTCHYPCRIPDDGERWRCAAMKHRGSRSAHCERCEGRCSWEMHKNTGERFELAYRTETHYYEDLKAKFHGASSEKATAHKMIASHVSEFEKAQAQLHLLIKEARDCLDVLNSIALKHNPLTQVDYIQLLIDSEKNKKQEGWRNRVDFLVQIKDQALLLTKPGDLDKHIEQEKKWKKRIGAKQ